MIEKLLRRFCSEDTKLVITALEKWVETHGPFQTAPFEILKLTSAAREIGGRIDRKVVAVVLKRLEREEEVRAAAAKRARIHEKMLETAGRVLLGEEFKEDKKAVIRATAAGCTASHVQQTLTQQHAQSIQQMYQNLYGQCQAPSLQQLQQSMQSMQSNALQDYYRKGL